MPDLTPLPDPFGKVMDLWKQFLAEVLPLARIKSSGMSIRLYQDNTCMEVAAVIAQRPTPPDGQPDTPTVIQAPP